MLSTIAILVTLGSAPGSTWSKPGVVEADRVPRVTYKAQIQGAYLVVSASHAEDWHTYAMDNDVRAKAKLAGKPSLGIELPTTVEVKGAEALGTWLQTEPDDMSQPELRWYRWGFSKKAHFAVKVDPSSLDEIVTVSVQGQACNAGRCLRVDLDLTVEPDVHRTKVVEAPVDALVPVKR